MRRLTPLFTLNAILLLVLSLMFVAVMPGCEPAVYEVKPPVIERKAGIEIKHRNGDRKIEVDPTPGDSLKIDIHKSPGTEKPDAEQERTRRS